MRLAITIMVIALVAAMAVPCCAGDNPFCKVAVHVRAHNAKAGCTLSPAITACEDIVTVEAGFSVDAFPIFYNLVEYNAVEYGMTWPVSWGSATFNNCADLVIGAITSPGLGASHAWTACHQEWTAVPGFLWLYASEPGQVCVVNHPLGSWGPGIFVSDCSEGHDNTVPCSFCAGVYGATGSDPCVECFPATEPTTWGEIKEIYR